MYLRGEISILVPAVFSETVAILTAPAVNQRLNRKKLKTVRGSYTDLDLSIHAKKGPKKSHDTLPLTFLQNKSQHS
jgi:hypothetical protein